MDEKENNEDLEDLEKFIKLSLEGMNKHFVHVFKLLSSQLGSKLAPGSSSSTPHVEGKTHGDHFFEEWTS